MILHIVGARPNFMKLTPLYREIEKNGLEQVIVHTGQHYDKNMSDVFFQKFRIPASKYNLDINGGNNNWQTAHIMLALEPVLLAEKPTVVVVYGDVNSTVAAAMVCGRHQVPLAHVEAGLRSGDPTMPEEMNRRVTDLLADHLYTPSADANENLLKEGVAESRIHLAGNIMIDTLIQSLPYTDDAAAREGINSRYGVVTLHRPSNTDRPEILQKIIQPLITITQKIQLVFPVHPRRRKEIEAIIAAHPQHNIILKEPVDYFTMLGLQKNAQLMITDSGGLQEESTYLHIPCLVLRENTERPITVTQGTGTLIGFDYDLLEEKVDEVLAGTYKSGTVPPYWDGGTASRILQFLRKDFSF